MLVNILGYCLSDQPFHFLITGGKDNMLTPAQKIASK